MNDVIVFHYISLILDVHVNIMISKFYYSVNVHPIMLYIHLKMQGRVYLTKLCRADSRCERSPDKCIIPPTMPAMGKMKAL